MNEKEQILQNINLLQDYFKDLKEKTIHHCDISNHISDMNEICERIKDIYEKKYEDLLDNFIREERSKLRAGSGDDLFYEQQVIDYINKQRKFWITFIKFIEKNIKF